MERTAQQPHKAAAAGKNSARKTALHVFAQVNLPKAGIPLSTVGSSKRVEGSGRFRMRIQGTTHPELRCRRHCTSFRFCKCVNVTIFRTKTYHAETRIQNVPKRLYKTSPEDQTLTDPRTKRLLRRRTLDVFEGSLTQNARFHRRNVVMILQESRVTYKSVTQFRSESEMLISVLNLRSLVESGVLCS